MIKIKMEYYIQNTEQGYLGNSIIFWAKGRNGYTADLNNSHKFTEEEAKQICNGNPKKNKAWAVDYIDNNKGIQRVVDCQHIDSNNIKKFDKEKSGIDDYFKDLQKWENSFYCNECGCDKITDFHYNRTVANGEVHNCKHCKTEMVVGTKPNEDKY